MIILYQKITKIINQIIQKTLTNENDKVYLKKDKCLQKKDRKLLII